MQRFLAAILVIGVLISAGGAPAIQAQADAVYSAPGPYAVGVRDLILVDADRPLNISIWYPATVDDTGPESYTYNWEQIQTAGQAVANAAPDPDGGPYPLVLFSHGLGGFRFQSIYLMEHLASYGFVVIAMDHPGSTFGEDSGGLVPDSMNENYALRPLDMLRVLDVAADLNAGTDNLAGLIDTDTVAVSGHSFGGYTALAAAGARIDFTAFNDWCREPAATLFDADADPAFTTEPAAISLMQTSCFLRFMGDPIALARGFDERPDGVWPATTDPRIKAVVALAPWNVPIFGPDGLAALTVPALVQVGSQDGTTPPERDAYAAYTQIGSATKSLVAYEGADHLVFINEDIMEDGDEPVWDVPAAHDLINHLTTAFLLAELTGDADAAALLAADQVDFAGVNYHRTE